MAIAEKDPGIVRIASRYGVPETVDRLERLLKERGLVVFARIDFSGDAARAGLKMRAEQALIFGNPKAPAVEGAGVGGRGRKKLARLQRAGIHHPAPRPATGLQREPGRVHSNTGSGGRMTPG